MTPEGRGSSREPASAPPLHPGAPAGRRAARPPASPTRRGGPAGPPPAPPPPRRVGALPVHLLRRHGGRRLNALPLHARQRRLHVRAGRRAPGLVVLRGLARG